MAGVLDLASMGIEKLVPRAADLGVFIRLLARSATGQPINSSTRFTYLIAWAGKSAQLRAPAVDCDHPSISS